MKGRDHPWGRFVEKTASSTGTEPGRPSTQVAPASSRRCLRVVGAGLAVALVVVTLFLRQPETPSTPMIAASVGLLALIIGLSATQRLAGVADWSVGALAPPTVALLVAGSGGAESLYQPLFLVILVITAVIWTTPRLLLESAYVAALAALPLLYDPSATTAGYAARFVTNIGIWTLVTFIVHLQAQHARRSSAELVESGERFRRLAVSLPNGAYVLRLQPERGFEFVNAGMEQATGFSADAYYANPDLALERVHPDDLERFLELRNAPDELDGPVEIRWLDADGNWRWLSPMAVGIHAPDGTLVAVQGTVQDISHHKRAEASLQAALDRERAATERLRALDEMKAGFLQALSHELRTPLTLLVGYSLTLERHAGDLPGAQLHELARRMVHASHRLGRLVDDLLDVDRLARGVLTADRRPTDLGALLRTVAIQLPPNGHRVLILDEPLVAEVDAAKVQRILENLLANAYRHTPDGTTITLAVEDEGDTVLLVVEDDGPGIPDDLKAEIFRPFQQGHEAAHAPSPGTGIGLALVQGFTTLHAGGCWVDDRPGGGARFCVRLPVATTGRTDVAAAPADESHQHCTVCGDPALTQGALTVLSMP